ncbi:MAG: hypothetical protein J5777_00760 [Clostridiales bacterium]|jgi:hypothetical protein|nr:hypothetical protein [Clostridiales bacterium]
MDERTTSEVVQDVMEDIAAKREETAKEEKTLAEKFSDSKAEQAQPEAPAEDAKKMDEITLKFGKGCVGDEFQGKDGVKYREILVPNQDKEDHRPWQTFVVKSNHVHENQFGKGMWCKLPANGSTTLHRSVKVGQDEQGKPIWDTEKTKVSNRDLKKMVEAYKDKDRDRSSMKEKLAEKQAVVAEQKPVYKAAEKSKSKETSL